MCLVLILLFFFIALIVGIGEDSPGLAISILILLLVGFLWAIWAGVQRNKKEQAEAELAKEAAAAVKRRYKERMEELINSLTTLHGNPTKIIRIDELNVVSLFAEKRIVCINKEELLFDNILSSKLLDDYQIAHGQITGKAETETDTASLIGRSAVGALVAGGAGAIIGASSASKETTTNYTQGNDKVIHDYTLLITLKKFDSPVIKVHIGDNREVATELEHMFILITNEKHN